jgi:hypothetical protein
MGSTFSLVFGSKRPNIYLQLGLAKTLAVWHRLTFPGNTANSVFYQQPRRASPFRHPKRRLFFTG